MSPKNSTSLLKQLRLLMKSKSHYAQALNAYIIPSGDAHQSEYMAPCDERRAFISGFTGSYGTAVVTETEAALWTDGRYFLQASKELDENWILMKQGLPNTPSEAKWLSQRLTEGSLVGVDPYLLDTERWNNISQHLLLAGHSLVPVIDNFIDLIWEDQPPIPANLVVPLEIEFTGQSFSEKLETLREKLREETAAAVILTALDEIAYLFNLRGSDISYNPVFFAYAILTLNDALLLIDKTKLSSQTIRELESCESNVQILPYEDVSDAIDNLLVNGKGKVWVSNRCSYAISEKIPKLRRLSKVSPVAIMKAVKNETEKKGLRACHIRDGAALCRYLCWLENEAQKGTQTEISAAKVLESFRKDQEHFVGLSFSTISAVGPNASIVHYSPSEETDRAITTEEIYLVDSGGQYKDGTTDVTRTLHFGTPKDFEKECFTRVLKGQIALANAVFPSKIKGNHLDALARKYLWDVGLDYGHGTGHGIGMYLNVHEGPMGISWRPYWDDPGLQEGMFLSDEPGFYEDGSFGIRLENIVEIVPAVTPYNYKSRGFLTFKTITLAPVQTKLICPSMLTSKEMDWLNSYHEEVFEKVGSLLLQQGHKETYDWLKAETQPIG